MSLYFAIKKISTPMWTGYMKIEKVKEKFGLYTEIIGFNFEDPFEHSLFVFFLYEIGVALPTYMLIQSTK